MSSWDFIIDGIRFSYSGISTFDTCKHAYKLTYIDAVPRKGNFYSEYGSFVHTCLEKYFSGELNKKQLPEYYKEHYDSQVRTYPPPNPPNMGETYKNQGVSFFNNFDFNKAEYDVVYIEKTIDFNISDVMFTARPDLVLNRTKDNQTILFDYKTAMPFREDKKTGKEIVDKDKINGYYKQMLIYTYALRNHSFTPIDEITLWFPRNNRMVTIPWDFKKEEETIEWLKNTVSTIRDEEEFQPNVKNTYFCQFLCSVKDRCKFI